MRSEIMARGSDGGSGDCVRSEFTNPIRASRTPYSERGSVGRVTVRAFQCKTRPLVSLRSTGMLASHAAPPRTLCARLIFHSERGEESRKSGGFPRFYPGFFALAASAGNDQRCLCGGSLRLRAPRRNFNWYRSVRWRIVSAIEERPPARWHHVFDLRFPRGADFSRNSRGQL